MSSPPSWQQRLLHLIEWLKGIRYVKFGIVGASGTVVNMLVLYVAQERLFASIADTRERLYASLALAIAVATVNNFTWNRLWTWADRIKAAQLGKPRKQGNDYPLVAAQFGRYALASWLGIGLQYVLTLWLAHNLHYLVANVMAILVASVCNYLANDRWTFGQRAPK